MLQVTQRKQLYALFNSLFSFPDQSLVELLESGRLLHQVRPLDDTAQLPELHHERMLESLQVAFTDHFINRREGIPAPPYGSVYLDAGEQLYGPSTQAVAATYQAEGLTLEQSLEPPDYLATELEFLYFLVDREEQALQRRDMALAQTAATRQARFFEHFFVPWVPGFCRRIAADPSTHPLYQWAAALLARFCSVEQEWLTKIVPA